jgi:hypothetical protein
MLTKEATSCGLKCFYMSIYTSIKNFILKIFKTRISGQKPLMLTKEATSCGLKSFYMPIYTSIKNFILKFFKTCISGQF